MKKLTLALCTLCFVGCYRADGLNGDPVECPTDCDDGVACTDDYCGADGVCGHFDHCLPPAECLSALDCEDGDECTVDYCDAGFCTAREICTETCGDTRILTNAIPAANFSVATDGERVMVAWQDSREFGDAGRYAQFPLLDPPEDAFSGKVIEAGTGEVRHPISVWPEAETPKVFWTHDNGDTANIMMADYDPDTDALGEAISLAITDPIGPVQARLMDVVYQPSGEYGLAFDGVRTGEDDPGAYFGRVDGAAVAFWQQIGPARSMNTRIALTASGYSLAYTAKPTDDGLSEVYEISYDSVGFAAPVLMGSGSHFDTMALASTSSRNLVFYDQMLTEDVNQLLVSWGDASGIATMDLDFMVRGIDTLAMIGEDAVLASWCNVDFATGQGALRVVRVGPGLLSSLLWIALPNGCAESKLLRAGDDNYVFWLDEPGEYLSYRKICE